MRIKRKTDQVVWCNRGWQPVDFCFCPSKKAWRNLMKYKKIPPEDAPYPKNDGNITSFTSGNSCFLVVSLNSNWENEAFSAHEPIVMVGTLVHEASHVLDKVIEHMQDESPSAEFKAYALQAIIQELILAFELTCGTLMYVEE